MHGDTRLWLLCELKRRNKGIYWYETYSLGHLDTLKIPFQCIFTCQSDNKYKIFADLASRSCSRFRVTDRFKCSKVCRTLVKGAECCSSGALASLTAADCKTNSYFFLFFHWIASRFTSLSHLKSALTLGLQPDGIKGSRQRQDNRRKFSLEKNSLESVGINLPG